MIIEREYYGWCARS